MPPLRDAEKCLVIFKFSSHTKTFINLLFTETSKLQWLGNESFELLIKIMVRKAKICYHFQVKIHQCLGFLLDEMEQNI